MVEEKDNKVENDSEIETNEQTNEGLGLEQNIAALLAYLFGFVGGLVFLLTEKNNKFIRFAAAQSIVFNVAIIAGYVVYFVISAIITAALGFLGLFLILITPILVLGLLGIWVVLMVKSYSNQEWELPIIGKIARSFVK